MRWCPAAPTVPIRCVLSTRVTPCFRSHARTSGSLALSALLAAVQTAWLEGPDLALVDPDGLALFHANGPEDLAHAEALLAMPSRRAP
jgi:hypothetical protein